MDKYKKYLPHLVAVVLFIIVTALFFKPLVFKGRQLKQSDIEHHIGMSKEIVDFRKTEGREPLWTNSMFGGMPAYQISVLYPSNYMNPLQKAFSSVTRIPFPVTSILLAMIGFYFLLISMKVNPWMSLSGAIAFGLTAYVITLVPAGHNSKMYAIAYMAPVVMGVLLAFRGRMWLGAGLTAISLALEISSNHLQITYYLAILLLFIGIGENIRLWKEKKLKELIRIDLALVVAVVLSMLPNYSNLALTNEYVKYTTRGASELTMDSTQHNKTDGLPIDYATQWCYTKSETFTLMIPNFMGGASAPIEKYAPSALKKIDPGYKQGVGGQSAYFGEVIFTSGPYYVGAIICFLFVLAMFIVKDKLKWWIFAASVLAIMLAWGHHFIGLTEFFFDYVPGYNKFRAVSMTLVIVNLTFPFLAMLAIKEIMEDPGRMKREMKKLYYAFGLTGGICLLVFLAPGAFVDGVNERDEGLYEQSAIQQGGQASDAYDFIAELETAREAIVKADAGRSFLLILIVAGVLWYYSRKPFHPGILAAIIGVLIVGDMWTTGTRYISDKNYEASKVKPVPYVATNADEKVKADPDKSVRVYSMTGDVWQDASTSYFHKAIGGYSAAKLKRIQELYEQVLSKQFASVDQAANVGRMGTPEADSMMQATLAMQGAFNMFNTKYILIDAETPLVNKHANGGAWFVDEVKIVANADSEIVAVGKINTKTTAVVDKRFQDQLNGFTPQRDPNAYIKVVSHMADRVEYESNSSVEQVAMFSEVYYPAGWNVTIDGKEAPYFCGDYVLRGMFIPSGTHKIVFEFKPASYYTGEKIAMIGSILVFLALLGGIVMDVRSRKSDKPEEPVEGEAIVQKPKIKKPGAAN